MNIKTLLHSAGLTLALGLTGIAAPDRAEAGPDPYIADIMIVGFNFCPRGWAEANGQLLAISSYDALFSLLGTQFGGDGRATFALPDMRGRIARGIGNGAGLGTVTVNQRSGATTATMTTITMPNHSHIMNANNLDGDKPGPGGKLLAAAPTGGTGNETIYSTGTPNKVMADEMIGQSGGSVPFSVEDPKLGLLHCIALEGLYPSRS